MKRFLLIALIAVLCSSPLAFAGPEQGGPGQTDPGQGDTGDPGTPVVIPQVTVANNPFPDPTAQITNKQLMEMVVKDLQLCLSGIEGKKPSFCDAFPAIAHLNHALKTLGKIQITAAYKPVMKELHKRISHARFYLVMHDYDEAAKRITETLDYIAKLGN
jgi:hypothetical protein